MSFLLIPNILADDLTYISPAFLRGQGIRLLMLDFDNTIVPYTTSEPSTAIADWIKAMQQDGVAMCVVSNSRKPRVQAFCRNYGLDCITHAKKPFSKGIRQCMSKYALPPEACALVGDQIYTDTLGANGCGVRSILVKAIHNHNFWLKLRHVAELPWIGIAKMRSTKL